MRQARVLLIGFLVAVALAATLHAQNYVWSSINGVPYSSGLVLSGPGLFAQGTAAAPSIAFAADPDTGFYQDGQANFVRVSAGGSEQFRVEATQTSIYNKLVANKWNVAYVTGTATAIYGTSNGGGTLTNEGDSDGASVALPGAEAGVVFTFCIQAAQTFTITAAAGDTIRLASGVTAAAGSISSNVIGSCVTIQAVNATEWFATSIVGSWSY